MECFRGKSAYAGIAIGKIAVLTKKDNVIKRVNIENPEAEIERVSKARKEAQAQLQVLYDKAVKEAGEDGRGNF